jgi:hypothetical protein
LDCPSARPINGEGCELSERIVCSYDEGSCQESFECQCTNGTFSCFNSCFESDEDEWKGGESRTDLGSNGFDSNKTSVPKQEETQVKLEGKKEQTEKKKKEGDQKETKEDISKSKKAKKNLRRLGLYRIRGLN